MRDRLIEIIRNSHCVDIWNHYTDDFKDPNPIYELTDAILEDGWIRPPCKVGDAVYIHQIDGHNEDGSPIFRIDKGRVFKIQIDSTKENTLWLGAEFGLLWCCRPYTDFYFTKEAAENALKESCSCNG